MIRPTIMASTRSRGRLPSGARIRSSPADGSKHSATGPCGNRRGWKHDFRRDTPERFEIGNKQAYSDLEAALRVSLFHRSTGNVKRPSLRGHSTSGFVPQIRGINETTEGVSKRTDSLTGRLRVAAPISLGANFLGPVVAEFARRHPELEIAVDCEDRLVSLTQRGYDVDIRIGDLKESSLKARKLCNCARIARCRTEYATNHGLPESVADLASHACIDYAHVRTSDLWQFDTEASGKSTCAAELWQTILKRCETGRSPVRVGASARIPCCRTSSRGQTDFGAVWGDAPAPCDFCCLSIHPMAHPKCEPSLTTWLSPSSRLCPGSGMRGKRMNHHQLSLNGRRSPPNQPLRGESGRV